jgi:hypothetical protein
MGCRHLEGAEASGQGFPSKLASALESGFSRAVEVVTEHILIFPTELGLDLVQRVVHRSRIAHRFHLLVVVAVVPRPTVFVS